MPSYFGAVTNGVNLGSIFYMGSYMFGFGNKTEYLPARLSNEALHLSGEIVNEYKSILSRIDKVNSKKLNKKRWGLLLDKYIKRRHSIKRSNLDVYIRILEFLNDSDSAISAKGVRDGFGSVKHDSILTYEQKFDDMLVEYDKKFPPSIKL